MVGIKGWPGCWRFPKALERGCATDFTRQTDGDIPKHGAKIALFPSNEWNWQVEAGRADGACGRSGMPFNHPEVLETDPPG
jgi:hypothetical protein